MIANESKSCLPYLNKLVDHHNNNYYHSINKKLINNISTDYSASMENIGSNLKAPKFKVNDSEVSVRNCCGVYCKRVIIQNQTVILEMKLK